MRLSRERIGASGNMDVGGARRAVGPGLRPGLRRSSPAGIAVRCRQNFGQIKSELRSDKFRTAVKCGQILHMIAIHGDQASLKTRIISLDQKFSSIQSWIDSELRVPYADALHMLELARRYVDGALS